MAKTKRLNKNLVIVLTALGFVLTTAAGIIMVYVLQTTDPEQFVKLAEEAAAKKEWLAAERYYFRAYNRSEDPMYLVLVGDMQYAAGEESRAAAVWSKAIEINPLLLAAHERKLDLQLDYTRFYRRTPGMWLNIRQTADAILGIAPESAKAHYAMGMALIELEALGQAEGDEAKGLERLKQAVTIAPEVVKYSQRLAQYYEAQQQFDEAQAVHTALIARNSRPGRAAAEARSGYAGFLLAQDEPEPALEFYEQATEMAGDDSEARSSILYDQARYWMQKWFESRRTPRAEVNEQALVEAKRLCEQAIETHPDCFQPYLLLSDLYRADNQVAEAAQVCDARIKRAIVRRGTKRFEQKRFRYRLLIKAAEQYATLALRAPAGSEERAESLKKARRHVTDAEAEMPNRTPTLETKAMICIVEGNTREATRLCEQADEAYGDWIRWQNKLRLAMLYLENGELGSARKAIEGAVRVPDASATCWTMYGRILLELDRPLAAVRATEAALQRDPANIAALEVQAAAYTALDEPERAETALVRIEEAGGEAMLTRVRALLDQDKADEAIDRLLQQLEKRPGQVPYVALAATLLNRADRNEEAMTVLRRALEVKPDNPRLQQLMTQLDGAKTDEEREAALRQRIGEIEDAFTRELRYGRLYERRREPAEAEKHYSEALRLLDEGDTPGAKAATPDTLRDLMERRLMLALSIPNLDLAEEIAETAIERNVDGANGLTFSGRVLLARGKPEEAMQAFKAALEQHPTNSKTLILLGECYLVLNRFSEARGAFERATEINPLEGLAWKGRALLAERSRDDARLEGFIAQCQKLIPNDPWVRERVTELREKDNPAEGIARREKLRAEHPSDVRNLLRLGQLYAANGEPAKADECYRQALDADPDNASVVWVVASFYREAGRVEEGLELLQNLVQSIEDIERKAETQLLVGAYYVDQGESAAADAAYRAAADIKPTESVSLALGQHFARTRRYEQAINWLEKAIQIAEPADGPPSPQASRIRRMQIECYLQLKQKENAQAKLAEYSRKYPDYPDDLNGLLLEAELEAIQGRIENAVNTLTRYLERRPADDRAVARVRYRRAQLNAALWRWQRVCDDLEQLRTADPRALNYQPRVLLARAYDFTNRETLAEAELKNVLEQDPSAATANVASELIRFYEKKGRLADAERTVTALLNQDPDNPRWLYTAGRIALNLNDIPKAFKMLLAACEKGNYAPAFVSKFFDACIESGRFETGIAFYEQSLPSRRRHPTLISRYAHLQALQAAKTEKSGDPAAAEQQRARAAKTFLLAIDVAGPAALEFVQSVARDAGAAFGPAAIDRFGVEPTDERLKRPAKHMLAALLAGHRRMEEATAVIRGLIDTVEDDAEHASLLVRLGLSHEMQDEPDNARQCYEESLKLDSDNLIALNNLAYLLTEVFGAHQQALPYAEKARLLDPSAEVLDTLGWIYVKLERYKDAIAELTQAFHANPDYVPALAHLGEAHRLNGNFIAAGEILNTALRLIGSEPEGTYQEYRPEVEASLRKARDKQRTP